MSPKETQPTSPEPTPPPKSRKPEIGRFIPDPRCVGPNPPPVEVRGSDVYEIVVGGGHGELIGHIDKEGNFHPFTWVPPLSLSRRSEIVREMMKSLEESQGADPAS